MLTISAVKVRGRLVGVTVSDRWNLESLALMGAELVADPSKGQLDHFRRTLASLGFKLAVLRTSKRNPLHATVSTSATIEELQSLGFSHSTRLAAAVVLSVLNAS